MSINKAVVALILVLLLQLPSIGYAEDAKKKKKPKRICDADDARCIAVTAKHCDLTNNTLTDMCMYVQHDKHCKQDVHRIHYLELFYCHSKALMSLAYILWMCTLFYIMTITAEMFLCPSIEYIVGWLHIPPDIAGVTLFAFASGAPDLFTQIAALAEGDHVDIELAVSATFGGGLFIICVVLSAVILSNSGRDVVIPDTRAYIRDASAYLIASVVTLGLLWRGQLTLMSALLLVVGYIVYLVLCFYVYRGIRAGSTDGSISINSVTPSGALEHYQAVSSGKPSSPSAFTRKQNSQQFYSSPGGSLTTPPMSPSSRGIEMSTTIARQRSTGSQGLEYSRSSLSSPSLVGQPLQPTLEHVPLTLSVPQQHDDQEDDYEDDDLLVHPSLPSGGYKDGEDDGIRSIIQRYVQSLPHAIEEALHLHGKTGWRRVLGLVYSPLVVIMHATMPAMFAGSFTMLYGGTVCLIAPLFMLLVTPLGGLVLDGSGVVAWIVCWLSSTTVLIVLILTLVPPVAGISSSPFLPEVSQRIANKLVIARPRRNSVFAILSFLQCIVWLNALADEVVALFVAIGRIFEIRQDVLGATVLAWGETIPDLVAVLSLARSGQSTMVIAACFGGPVFNLLVSMGGPILFAVAEKGSLPYSFTSGVLVLIGSTVLVLGFLLIVPSFKYNWTLTRGMGVGIMCAYALSQVVFLMAEGHVLVVV